MRFCFPPPGADGSEEGVSCRHRSGRDASASGSNVGCLSGYRLHLPADGPGRGCRRKPVWEAVGCLRQGTPAAVSPPPRPAAGSRSAEFASPSLGVPAETRGHGPPHLCCLMALRRSTRCAKVKQKLTGEGSPHSVDEGRLGKAGGGPRNRFHGMRGHTRPPRHHSPLSPLLL